MNLTDILHAVDVHAEGELTRVIVSGLPPSRGGATKAEQRLALIEDDGLRRYLLGEPRGHLCLHAVCVYPPADPDAAAGVVIMESTDYPAMSGSNLICTATVLLETGMVPMREPVTKFAIETAAGLVKVEAQCENGSCESVRFENVPSYVVRLDIPIELPGYGTISVDVAWGGAFFAFIDAATFGLETFPSRPAGWRGSATTSRPRQRRRSRSSIRCAPICTRSASRRSSVHRAPAARVATPPWSARAGWTAPHAARRRGARLAILHARGQLAAGEDFGPRGHRLVDLRRSCPRAHTCRRPGRRAHDDLGPRMDHRDPPARS